MSGQFTQQGPKLVGAGAIGSAFQGGSVAISGDGNTILVGGQGDDGNRGAVWVYSRDAGVWKQQAKLVGKDSVNRSSLGNAIALSGDGNTALVGGPFDSGDTGAIWVFTRAGAVWSQQGSKLTASDASGPARFGASVALSDDGNTAIAGGPADNGGPGAGVGAAWVFTRSNGAWRQQGPKLVGTGAVGGALQGISVAISGNGATALVGGMMDSQGAGAAWVFTRAGENWIQQGRKLVGSGNLGEYSSQGNSVSLSADGNTAIIGGPTDNQYVGAAWVFVRSEGVWAQQGKLVGGGTAGTAYQGSAVALSRNGNIALVGGPQDNSNPPRPTGATWVHERTGASWNQQGGKLVGAGAVGLCQQGRALALSADATTAVVGGMYDNEGVGAAWVFVADRTGGPAITGVQNGASFMTGPISSGSWITVYGTQLAPAGSSRQWKTEEIVNGKLPLTLDGTGVTVNGKPAPVAFISPSQLNILTPDDIALGPVQVIVNTAAGSSNAFTVNHAQFAPGLFLAGLPYILAQHADGSPVNPAAPARAGEVIILWGTGFGPSEPMVPTGQVFSGAAALANPLTVTIGQAPAAIEFAGIVGPGLVQINVRVPSGIGNGDMGVIASIVGVTTQTFGNSIPVRN